MARICRINILGKEILDKAMQEYYKRWQFKHPQPEDLNKALKKAAVKILIHCFPY